MGELDDYFAAMQGIWANPQAIPDFLDRVRAGWLTAEEISRLLDRVPGTRTGTTGDACRLLAEGLERIRQARINEPGAASRKRNIIFISCGQFTPEERELGRAISALIEALTPFEPYFADQVSDLEGLTGNIFAKLYQAVALVTVMHHRGTVQTPDGSLTRASVWIEQEIAIAAFIRQILGRDLRVAPFEKHGVEREGVRQQLILNPYRFGDESEVLEELRRILPRWTRELARQQTNGFRPVIEIEREGPSKHKVAIWLENNTSEAVREFRAEILVPRAVVPPGTTLGGERSDLSTETQRAIIYTQESLQHDQLPIYAGQRVRLCMFTFDLGLGVWLRRAQIANDRLQVFLRTPNEPEALAAARTIDELGLAAYQPQDPIEVMDPMGGDHSRVRAFLERSRSAGQPIAWQYESEVPFISPDGAPFCLVDGRRVITYAHRNKNDRSKPPEYLVYSRYKQI